MNMGVRDDRIASIPHPKHEGSSSSDSEQEYYPEIGFFSLKSFFIE